MENILEIALIVTSFISGVAIGAVIYSYFRVRPFIEQHQKLVQTLERANKDNLVLMSQIKFLQKTGLSGSITVHELDKEEGKKIIEKIFKDFKNDDDIHNQEVQKEKMFYIEQLTIMNAKGWSPDDTLEELKKLYELL